MKKEENKRKINRAKTLQVKHIQRKIKVGAFVQVNSENIKKQETDLIGKKTNIVGQFQLVVVKLPWYKKVYRSLLGFLGFYYN